MFLAVGSYVYLKRCPETLIGTIAGGAMQDGRMRYIFHLDERITSIQFSDVHVYESEIQSCERPSEMEIERINRVSGKNC